MIWKRVIVYTFLLIVFFVALQRIIANVVYFNDGLYSGVISRVEIFSDTDGYNTRRAFYMKKDSLEYKGVYGEKDDFYLEKGDTVNVRRLFNGSVRVITKNNVQIQSYYGFWDYGSVIVLLVILFSFKFYPRLLKKLKQNEDYIN